jgi:hypothetical protein
VPRVAVVGAAPIDDNHALVLRGPVAVLLVTTAVVLCELFAAATS